MAKQPLDPNLLYDVVDVDAAGKITNGWKQGLPLADALREKETIAAKKLSRTVTLTPSRLQIAPAISSTEGPLTRDELASFREWHAAHHPEQHTHIRVDRTHLGRLLAMTDHAQHAPTTPTAPSEALIGKDPAAQLAKEIQDEKKAITADPKLGIDPETKPGNDGSPSLANAPIVKP